jgi:hypothetical protein
MPGTPKECRKGEAVMRHVKPLGLAAITAAMMAFLGADSASATILTNPAGTQVPKGTKIAASMESSVALRIGLANVTCTEGSIEGTTTTAGTPTETVRGIMEKVSFTKCNCERVEVTSGGVFEVHTENNDVTPTGNGTLTSDGTTVIITCVGITCKYITEHTDIGTLTGSVHTGGTATMDINASLLKEEGSSMFCSMSGVWEGLYKVTNPDYLDVD